MTETTGNGNLVLTRKGAAKGEQHGERIRIGKDIWITIGEVRGDKCKVIVNAPREVPVVREECLEPDEQYAKVIGLDPKPDPKPDPDPAADLRRTA